MRHIHLTIGALIFSFVFIGFSVSQAPNAYRCDDLRDAYYYNPGGYIMHAYCRGMKFAPDVTAPDTLSYLKAPGHTSVVREWNCSGRTTCGAREKRSALQDDNGHFIWAARRTDKPLSSGATGYKPVVGNGTPAVRRRFQPILMDCG